MHHKLVLRHQSWAPKFHHHCSAKGNTNKIVFDRLAILKALDDPLEPKQAKSKFEDALNDLTQHNRTSGAIKPSRSASKKLAAKVAQVGHLLHWFETHTVTTGSHEPRLLGS